MDPLRVFVTPPLPVQLVALADDQVIVLVPPLDTLVGFAEIVTVAAGGVVTVTVTEPEPEPPEPVQVRANVLLVVSAPVATPVPDVDCAPDQAPEAVHVLAFVVDQVRALALPETTVVGLAVMVTVGAGVVTVTIADCVAVPAGPVQFSVNVLVVVNAPVDTPVPEVPLVPDQAPAAVQLVAFVVDHVRALALPETTVVGLAVMVIVGAGAVTVTVVD